MRTRFAQSGAPSLAPPMTTLEPPAVSLASLLPSCTAALAAWNRQPHDDEACGTARAAARLAAAAVSALPKVLREGELVEAARNLVHLFLHSGRHDWPTDTGDLALAGQLRRQGWPGLLAAMILAPAWEARPAFHYDEVPLWLWPELTDYLFATPRRPWIAAGTEARAAHLRRSLEMLGQLAQANRGSAAVQGALQAYRRQAGAEVLALSAAPLADTLALRGKLLARILAPEPPTELLPLPREDRALRLGVCLPRLDDTPAVRATLAYVGSLPAEKFEVQYFVEDYTDGAFESHLRQTGAVLSLLETNSPQSGLLGAALDAALLVIDPLAAPSLLTELGSRRFAPLQLAFSTLALPTGLPEVDLWLSPEENSVKASAAERPGLLALPGLVCPSFPTTETPATTLTREALGLAPSAPLLVSFAVPARISPAQFDLWTAILTQAPDATLLLQLLAEDASAAESLPDTSRQIDQEFTARGVASDRVVILGAPPTGHADWLEVLRLADVYLDTAPCSSAPAVAAAFEAGVPVVCQTGPEPRQRSGAALLQAEHLSHCIAANAAEGVAHTCRLLASEADRAALRSQLQQAQAAGLRTHDTLAAADAFAALVTAAFDEVATHGLRAFRSARTPFRVTLRTSPADQLAEAHRLLAQGRMTEALTAAEQLLGVQPADASARRLMGKILGRLGKLERAGAYQLSLIQRDPQDSAAWLDLARTLADSGRMENALQALETGLRLDGQNVDAWFLFGELSLKAGNASLGQEVVAVLQKLAPGDARLAPLARNLNALLPARTEPEPAASYSTEVADMLRQLLPMNGDVAADVTSPDFTDPLSVRTGTSA